MTEEDALPEPTPPRPRFRPQLFAAGFLVAGITGMALAFVAFLNNAPMWAVPVLFLAPPLVFFIAFGSRFFARAIRAAREAARNAPSPESVAAIASGAGIEVGTKPEKPAGYDDTPTVPRLETTPGKVLAHRLPRAGLAPGCQFGCAVAVACFWNGIVGVFVFQLARKWGQGGAFQWIEAAFLVPFVVIGLLMIGFAVAAGLKWIVAGLVGSVEVELSAHPLAPGREARVHVAQRGLFPLARVSVWLVCAEEATYVAGTSKSAAREEVAKHTVADPDQNPDGGGLPLETAFTVPADAMHSFEAPNNKITWTLRVRGRVLGLPFSDEYGVIVGPGEPGASATG
jgi:hypothetical protein